MLYLMFILPTKDSPIVTPMRGLYMGREHSWSTISSKMREGVLARCSPPPLWKSTKNDVACQPVERENHKFKYRHFPEYKNLHILSGTGKRENM